LLSLKAILNQQKYSSLTKKKQTYTHTYTNANAHATHKGL